MQLIFIKNHEKSKLTNILCKASIQCRRMSDVKFATHPSDPCNVLLSSTWYRNVHKPTMEKSLVWRSVAFLSHCNGGQQSGRLMWYIIKTAVIFKVREIQ